MKIGRSPALALVLFGCTSTRPEPAPTATTTACHVEISIEAEGRTSRVDLGPGSCTEKKSILIARDRHPPDGYFVALALSGPLELPVVSSDVVRVSKELAPEDPGALVLFHAFAKDGREVSPEASPAKTRTIVPGQWSEIAAGEWSATEPYRVYVRLERGTERGTERGKT